MKPEVVRRAMLDMSIDPEKVNPLFA